MSSGRSSGSPLEYAPQVLQLPPLMLAHRAPPRIIAIERQMLPVIRGHCQTSGIPNIENSYSRVATMIMADLLLSALRYTYPVMTQTATNMFANPRSFGMLVIKST